MKLHITDEFSPLKSAVVCWADHAPIWEEYKSSDPEFIKYHPFRWDKSVMLKQQEQYFALLERYGVSLIFPQTAQALTNQMFTRDTAFVIGDTLFYGGNRKYGDRNGEIVKLLDALRLEPDQVVSIEGNVEGGDVLIAGDAKCFLGQTSRTGVEAAQELSSHAQVYPFVLGDHVMHLDTRLTVLPNNVALCHIPSFLPSDIEMLRSRYTVVEVTDAQKQKLGTNVFVINPETIVVPIQHSSIGDALRNLGFKIELIDYTEPINFGGSFRCTTLPLYRAD